ncbi:RHS repeat protein [Cobetia crustatorum]|uniref:RHS repeat protein n=1 Tax=Cobetia crustatorum TaxID=553385 RepID=A0A558HQM6_9GAMM|nr:RHS repeat protein [Cobetia crustatorum]TVU71371.1 RHS repeat protein [Cobetia crustatorum]
MQWLSETFLLSPALFSSPVRCLSHEKILANQANENSETRFYFDDADNLIAESQQHQLPNGHQLSAVTRHTHDALGNRESSTLPDGQQISWLRYGSGHVLSMALDNEELLGSERDDLHREVRRHQRGRETTSQYDPVGRLIAQHSQLQQRSSSQGATVQGAGCRVQQGKAIRRPSNTAGSTRTMAC